MASSASIHLLLALLLVLLSFVRAKSGSTHSTPLTMCLNSTMKYDKNLQKCCTVCSLGTIVEVRCSNITDTMCERVSTSMLKTMITNRKKFVIKHDNTTTTKSGNSYVITNVDTSSDGPTPKMLAPLKEKASLVEIVSMFTLCSIIIAVTLAILVFCIRRRLLVRKAILEPCVVPQSPDEERVVHADNRPNGGLYLSDDYVNPCDITTALLQCRQIRNTLPGDSDSTSLASSSISESGVHETQYKDVEICTNNVKRWLREQPDTASSRPKLLNGSCTSTSEASCSYNRPKIPNGACSGASGVPDIPHSSRSEELIINRSLRSKKSDNPVKSGQNKRLISDKCRNAEEISKTTENGPVETVYTTVITSAPPTTDLHVIAETPEYV